MSLHCKEMKAFFSAIAEMADNSPCAVLTTVRVVLTFTLRRSVNCCPRRDRDSAIKVDWTKRITTARSPRATMLRESCGTVFEIMDLSLFAFAGGTTLFAIPSWPTICQNLRI